VFGDFEKAMHLYILTVWSSIILKICRFYLGESNIGKYNQLA